MYTQESARQSNVSDSLSCMYVYRYRYEYFVFVMHSQVRQSCVRRSKAAVVPTGSRQDHHTCVGWC